jgi:glycosyltransferase involved in cell wall biosynthesis
MRDVLALSWFEHRRTRGLCAGLGVELVVLATESKGAVRYLLLSLRTLWLLARRRPRVLVVQSPSLVLAALGILLRPLSGYRVVVDAHNEAVAPFINRQRWVRRVAHWLLRRADLTIVTNTQLARIVEQCGGRAFVLPDRIPSPPAGAPRPLRGDLKVVLIATFAPDEPLAAVLEAVRGEPLTLYVTGNHRKLDGAIAATVPPNVSFTGFLDEAEYWGLLRAADAILDLTLMPDCLVCGAYEALALGKATVLSDNAASVELFGEVALFTDNSPGDIRRALRQVALERRRLEAAAAGKRRELDDAWNARARQLLAQLTAHEARTAP